MPKNKLKPVPVLRLGQFIYSGSTSTGKEYDWLCLPLTPESRKVMIEALRESITEAYCQSVSSDTMKSLAEAALSALEDLAK